MARLQKAAFFRVEGTLTARPTLAAAAWMAANAQAIGDRVTRLGNVALAVPFALAGPWRDARLATRVGWMALRGMTEDRLFELGREYYDRQIEPHLRTVGLDLIATARAQGCQVILISDSLDVIVRPLADRVGAAELVCNRLEMKRGGAGQPPTATGRLREPVVAGNLSGQWARAFADERKIDLAASSAYGARDEDGLLLSAIGRPCAVSPDRHLRRLARSHDWPVVEG